mmetsp:Transcript_63988/g.151365  ORF Transcript_63988/g.151365 Transcript_63988/m.151365 type:complete len:280 (+) Transcript_63988:245-1084(+)
MRHITRHKRIGRRARYTRSGVWHSTCHTDGVLQTAVFRRLIDVVDGPRGDVDTLQGSLVRCVPRLFGEGGQFRVRLNGQVVFAHLMHLLDVCRLESTLAQRIVALHAPRSPWCPTLHPLFRLRPRRRPAVRCEACRDSMAHTGGYGVACLGGRAGRRHRLGFTFAHRLRRRGIITTFSATRHLLVSESRGLARRVSPNQPCCCILRLSPSLLVCLVARCDSIHPTSVTVLVPRTCPWREEGSVGTVSRRVLLPRSCCRRCRCLPLSRRRAGRRRPHHVR